jgi:uncharacterized membrane protein YqjE
MNENQKLSKMIESLQSDVTGLVQDHIELAKAELRETVKNASIATGLNILALSIAWVGLIFLFIAGAFGISAAGLPDWLSFLIMGLGLFVVAGLCVAIGILKFKKAAKPKRTIQSLNKTYGALSKYKKYLGM